MPHELYIKRCLQIAKKGIGITRPNPAVGAVIVHQNNIIGEGFTSPYGGSHAEVNAINAVKNKGLLKEASIYVTLEPCSHYGKTPPCADLIAHHQLKNVIIGCTDTNPLVAGKGIERLKKAGCNVVVGILEEECQEHHKRFFTVQNKKRPYIILKWAQTQDGFIYPEFVEKELKQTQHKKPIWISNNYSQQLVHKWRAEEHAILVGTNTVVADNPKLNVRSWAGNNPIRIVLDRNLRIPSEMNIFDGSVETIVISENRREKIEERKDLKIETIDFSKNIAQQICEVLQQHQIQSVIIEGGAQTLQTFIDADLWDEARVFTGATSFKKGIKAPIFLGNLFEEKKVSSDVLKFYKNYNL